MKFTLSLVSMLLLCSICFAQTTMNINPGPPPKNYKNVALGLSFGTMALTVALVGIQETELKKNNNVGWDNAILTTSLMTALFCGIAIDEHYKLKRYERGVKLEVAPTAFSLSYRF